MSIEELNKLQEELMEKLQPILIEVALQFNKEDVKRPFDEEYTLQEILLNSIALDRLFKYLRKYLELPLDK